MIEGGKTAQQKSKELYSANKVESYVLKLNIKTNPA